MRILWVKAGKLLPVDTGGKIRSFNILRKLACNNTVTVLSYYGGAKDAAYEANLGKELPGAHCISTGAPDGGTFTQALDYLRRLANPAPYAVSKFTDGQVVATLRQWLPEGRFDVAVCDFLSASLNFPHSLPLPCVLFQHNVESSLWARMAKTETNPVRKLSYLIESAKMERYERSTLRRFHHVIAVSETDKQQMLAMDPQCEISVVPTGVDTEKYQVFPSASGEPPRIAFTGSMDWEPNIDAVEWFCREIWPTIVNPFPKAKFQIVGRNPHARVKQLASATVEVTGTVPSVSDYLRDAAVVIVPLRIGGGTRLKIFEAMAMGKALVSTTIGAEGLDVRSGENCILADDPASFANSILTLLNDAPLRRKYEKAAAALAARYDWSNIARQFEDVLQHTIGARPKHSVPTQLVSS
jgi:glycosyltransferase involved in cell wall biosynthesis